MICYRDRSFCSEKKCKNFDCSLLFTQEMKNNASVWWNNKEPDVTKWKEAPVAFSEYKDTEFCMGYKE